MFQQIFRSQSSDVVAWAVVGLGIFVSVYVLRVLAIARQSREDIGARARQPLEEDHIRG